MVPQLTTVAFLSNTSMDAEPPNNYDPEAQNKQLLEAARALGRQVAFGVCQRRTLL
jgi:hypothetical protein